MKRLMFLVPIALFLAWPANAETTYRFGIVPQQNLKVMTKLWPQVLAMVEKRSGIHLEYKSTNDIVSFEKAMKEGEYDFAYMNPYHYAVMFSDRYSAFARENIKLVGLLVVAKNSRYKSLQDLKDSRISFPSPLAYGATVLMKEDLKASGVDPERDIKVQYSGDHDKGYAAVIRGYSDAAGGVPRTFSLLQPEIASKLRVLHKSVEVTPHAFAANKRIASSIVEKVAAALIDTCKSDEGRPLCEELGMKELISAKDEEWSSLRSRHAK